MKRIITLFFLTVTASSAFAKEIPEYCLENDAAHAYMTEVTYPDDDYTFTKITDYCDPEPWRWYKYDGYRKDQPKPVPLTWEAAADAESLLLKVYESDIDTPDTLSYTLSATAASYDLYNLIPGRTYTYKVFAVKADEQTLLDDGEFRTTGQLRMLKIDNIFNVRDMGGWAGLGGNPIKYGQLIRGSRMNWNGTSRIMITDEGKEELLRQGIKAELDMRDIKDNNYNNFSPIDASVDYTNIERAYESRIATFANSPASIKGVQFVINELKKNKPVYFHCSVGADRTGTVAFLIGALCGMSESDLAKEFELTSFSGDSIITSGRQEDLRRRRTYEGRFDPNDNPASYQYATMIDKVKDFAGQTFQRKVYTHLKNGVNGTSISEADLDWLIQYMTGYKQVKKISCDKTRVNMKVGETIKVTATFEPADATNGGITYSIKDEQYATVDQEGNVTAIAAASKGTYLIMTCDDMTKTIKLNIAADPSNVTDIDAQDGYAKIYNTAGQLKSDASGLFIRDGKLYYSKE